MTVDFDTELTRHAARILRTAARIYDRSDDETWFSGYNPVRTAWSSGLLDDLAVTGSPRVLPKSWSEIAKALPVSNQEAGRANRVTLKQLFRLPQRLPAVRLPPAPELAALGRSAPFMVKLDEFARWLGRGGRPVTQDRLLHAEDEADAVRWLDVRPGLLPYLWEHALITGWFELVDGPDGSLSWVVPGRTAYRWADGDIVGGLRVWGIVFASVLARTLEVHADQAPDAARLLNFQGQGVALAVLLFLTRRIGLTTGDASGVIQDGTIGDQPDGRVKKAWEAWVRQFGDPTRPLLRELAALRAVSLPAHGYGVLTLSPLAQWALREQFMLDDIDVSVIPVRGELSAGDLVQLADVLNRTEFEEEAEAWISRRHPGKAALDLLMHAASADARARITAVNIVRRIGAAAGGAWTEALQSSKLRGYACIALSRISASSRESGFSLLGTSGTDELDGVAADLLSLIGDDNELAPQRLAARLAEVIDPGEERWTIGLLARSDRPDARRLLELLRRHPDRDIARQARKVANAAMPRGPSLVKDAQVVDSHRQQTRSAPRSLTRSPDVGRERASWPSKRFGT